MKSKKQSSLLHRSEPYLWILPSVLLMSVFIIVPIGCVFYMAFSKVTKAGLVKGFNGVANFSKVLGSKAFSVVLSNTLVWTVVVVGLSTLLGFILALLLNNKFRGRKIARAIIVFPWATTLVIQASAWKFIIDTDYGALNTLLKSSSPATSTGRPAPALTSPGKSPAAFSSPFPSSASPPCRVFRASTIPIMRRLLWTVATTGSSCSTLHCLL